MTTSACPDRSAWKALLRGQISSDEELRLQQHLDGCPQCQKALETSAGSTAFLVDLAAKLQRTHSELSPELANLLDTSNGDEAETTQIDDRHPFVVDPTTLLAPTNQPEVLGLIDVFEVLEVLGQGGMGVVFKARDPKLRRLVAIKVLSPYLLSDQTSRQRFLREARAAAAVNHPNAVAIYSVNDPDDGQPNPIPSRGPYLVMEFVDGPSLHRRIARNNPMSVSEVLRVASHVAAALTAFHARGLIHRDVKPANILLDLKAGRAKLTDFGLTRGPEDVSLTKTGIVVGTPAFMSPEQAIGQAVDSRSDLFSLGSVMFAMLAGRAPFRDQDTVQTLLRLRSSSPPSIATIRDDLPPDLIHLIDRLQAFDPNERPQSAADVLTELRRLRSSTNDSTAMPSLTMPVLPKASSGGDQSFKPKRAEDPQTRKVRARRSPRHRNTAMVLLAAIGVSLLVWAIKPSKDDKTKDSKPSATLKSPSSLDSKRLPFVVLHEDGSVSQSAESLSAAVAHATPKALTRIRIQGDGPFPIEPLIIRGRRLWIEAAEQSCPVLVFNHTPRDSRTAMIDTDDSLILMGIELQASDLASHAENAPPLIQATGSELRLAHCCLRGSSVSEPLIRASASRVSLSHSAVFSGATNAVSWRASANGTLSIDNNLFAGFGAILVESSSPPPLDHEIQLTDNTFVSQFPVQVHFGKRDDAKTFDRRKLQFVVERNQFRALRSVVAVAWSVSASEMPRRPDQMLPLVMQWGRETDNVYLLNANASWISNRFPGTDWSVMSLSPRELPLWISYWQNRPTDRPQALKIDFARAGLIDGTDAQRLDLSVEDFRVPSVGRSANPPGADADKLGPGPAFDAWRRSESARHWLDALKASASK